MYFDQAEVALPGFHKLFKEYSDREMSNAVKLMTYMNLREGSNKFIGIPVSVKVFSLSLSLFKVISDR